MKEIIHNMKLIYGKTNKIKAKLYLMIPNYKKGFRAGELKVVDGIDKILGVLWRSGTLSYCSTHNPTEEEVKILEDAVTKVVLYMTRVYHSRNRQEKK